MVEEIVKRTLRKMNINAPMQANKMETSDKETRTPRKRGRPRKKDLNPGIKSTNVDELKDRSMKEDSNKMETSVKVALTPRKRGRPRKKVLNAEDKSINLAELKDRSVKGNSGVEEISGAKDLNRNSKRIRIAKVIFSPTMSDHKKLVDTSSSNVQSAKPGKSRKLKDGKDLPVEISAKRTSLTNQSVNEQMEKSTRKRGRPSKLKLKEVTKSPEPEKRGKSTTEKPARKRGRPSKVQEDKEFVRRGNSTKKVSKKLVNQSENGIEMLNNEETISSIRNLMEYKKVGVKMYDVVKSGKRGRGRPKKNSNTDILNSAEKSENFKECFHCRRFNLAKAVLEVGQTMAEHIVLHHGLNHDPPLCDICGTDVWTKNPQLDFGNFIEHFMQHRLDIENAQLELQQTCAQIPEHTKAAIAGKEKIKRETEAESTDEILGDTTNAIVKTSASDDGDVNLVENPYFQPEVFNIES